MYEITKGYGEFQWFLEKDGVRVSEHTSRIDAEAAKFDAECAFS